MVGVNVLDLDNQFQFGNLFALRGDGFCDSITYQLIDKTVDMQLRYPSSAPHFPPLMLVMTFKEVETFICKDSRAAGILLIDEIKFSQIDQLWYFDFAPLPNADEHYQQPAEEYYDSLLMVASRRVEWTIEYIQS